MIRILKKTSPDATVYNFRIYENGEESNVTIKRVGIEFYQRRQENHLVLIGHLKELMEWLYERNAMWKEERKGKDRFNHLFYGTEAAQQCLNLGGSVYSIEMRTIISYDYAYRLLLTSEGRILSDLPKGEYAAAFTECMKKQTKAEVLQKEDKEVKSTKEEEVKQLRFKNMQQQTEISMTKAALNKAKQQTMDKSSELERVKKSRDNYKKTSLGILVLGVASVIGSYFLGKKKDNGHRLSA